MRYRNILEAVGRTPLVRLNRMNRGLKPEIYAKCEQLNPGGSVKDRIAITMIDDAERRGLIKPGGTIIEGTSGNTGMGLALVAAIRGYKVIFTITDKQSREKIDLLKSFGAEVIVCPTAVAPDDPRSYYSVAKKLSREIPNSYYPNQYDNPQNTAAHFETTGPEIWEDTEGRITHFVAGMGTGGTISGIGKFLKQKNPKVKIIGVDPEGSLYYEFFHTGKIGSHHPYVVEGIGEDIFPSTMDFSVVDDVIRVNDADCFLTARRLARQEGLFGGGSTGAAVWGALQVARDLTERDLLVVLIPDTGRQYLSKVYNDAWMRENRYLEPAVRITAGECLSCKKSVRELMTVAPSENAHTALQLMQSKDISQLPVFEEGMPVGTVIEEKLVSLIMQGRDLKKTVVREVMGPAMPTVKRDTTLDQITGLFSGEQPAVFVEIGPKKYDILTKYDLMHAITSLSAGGR